jgi:hypothetical protein
VSDSGDAVLIAYNLQWRIGVAVIGSILLFPILLVIVLLHAKPPSPAPLASDAETASSTAVEKCACLSTSSARLGGLDPAGGEWAVLYGLEPLAAGEEVRRPAQAGPCLFVCVCLCVCVCVKVFVFVCVCVCV